MQRITFAALGAVAAMLAAAPLSSANVVRPDAGPGWVYLGTTHAQHMHDHDTLIVAGPHNSFRALRIHVTDAPLRVQRMLVTYENGGPEEVPIRAKIPKNGMSRAIQLHGGRRSVRQIDFWYDTKGWLRGTADVTVFGQR